MSMHRRVIILFLGLTLLALMPLGAVAQAPSPLSGTWTLNVAKSKYNPANLAAKSGKTVFEVTADGIKAAVDGVNAEGKATHFEYNVKFDGKDHPWKGTIDGKPNPDQDGISARKIDDYTYETTNKLKGQTLTVSRIVVARDGKTRTNTLTGKPLRVRL